MNYLLGGGMSPFAGIRVYESENCLKETDEPREIHKWTGRKSSTGQYHWRVQKKWVKRWGYVMKPVMYETAQGFICHPSLAAELRRRLAE